MSTQKKKISLGSQSMERFIPLLERGMYTEHKNMSDVARDTGLTSGFIRGLLGGRYNISPYRAINVLIAVGMYSKEVIPEDITETTADKIIASAFNRMASSSEVTQKPKPKKKHRWSYLNETQNNIVKGRVTEGMNRMELNSSQLCRLAEISPPYLYDFIAGKRTVSENTLLSLCSVLSIDLVDMFFDIGKVPSHWQSQVTKDELREFRARYTQK